MLARCGHFVLLTAALAVVVGCKGQTAWWRKTDKAPAAPAVATTMPAADAVKVFDEAVDLVTDLRYKEAAEKFESVVDALDEAGDHRRAAEAVFWFAYCREKLRHSDSATKLYKRLIEKFPDSAAAERGKQRLAALKKNVGGG